MTEEITTTTESIIKSSIEQGTNAIMPVFTSLLKFAFIITVIAIAFMFIKFLIIKAVKKSKNNKKIK